MRPRLPHCFVLLLLLFASGCGDDSSPTGPGGGGFDVRDVFTGEEAVVESTDPEIRLRMVGVQFEAGTANLTAGATTLLDKFGEVFANLPGATYRVEGHTDERGTADANQHVSQAQADEVRAYLVDEVGGVAGMIEAIGYGEARPIDPRSTAEAWALNRRIEIWITTASGEVFQVAFSADVLTIQQDCDAYSGSASASAGDFYISVALYRVVEGQGTEIGASPVTLYQGNDGETVVVGLETTGAYDSTPDAELLARLRIFEADPDGVRQFDEIDGMRFTRSQASDCWVYAGDDVCLGKSGAITAGVTRVRNVAGDPCAVDLSWSLRVNPGS